MGFFDKLGEALSIFLHFALDIFLFFASIGFRIIAKLLKVFWKLAKYVFTYVFSEKTRKAY